MIEQQKKTANQVFDKLRAFDPYCILAGGAPRDWYLGKTAADLDFFVYQQSSYATTSSIETRLNSIGLDYTLKFAYQVPEYEINKNITCVVNVRNFDTPVQIIVMKCTTFGLVEDFPISISQAWYTPERGIVSTRVFRQSVNTKTIWITNKLYCDKNAYIKKKKIKSKFQDYKFID